MKTKILMLILLASSALFSCNDPKTEEKSTLGSLLKVHDEVMANSEVAMKNKAALDSLTKVYSNDPVKQQDITSMKNQLTTADEAMETWMHKFNADNSGKSHQEIMGYYAGQRQLLLHVDTLLKLAINQSNKYLNAK